MRVMRPSSPNTGVDLKRKSGEVAESLLKARSLNFQLQALDSAGVNYQQLDESVF